MPKLARTTKRLQIRLFTPQDYSAWKATLSVPMKPKNRWDLRREEAPKDLNKATFAKMLRHWDRGRRSDKTYNFGVFLKDGTLIGAIALMDVTRKVFQNANVGYAIYNSFWRRGYGKEALRAALDIAFRDLRLHRVEAGVMRNNRRSIALVRSVGLRREGFSPKRLFLDGEWLDMVIYAATSERFRISWKKP